MGTLLRSADVRANGQGRRRSPIVGHISGDKLQVIDAISIAKIVGTMLAERSRRTAQSYYAVVQQRVATLSHSRFFLNGWMAGQSVAHVFCPPTN